MKYSKSAKIWWKFPLARKHRKTRFYRLISVWDRFLSWNPLKIFKNTRNLYAKVRTPCRSQNVSFDFRMEPSTNHCFVCSFLKKNRSGRGFGAKHCFFLILFFGHEATVFNILVKFEIFWFYHNLLKNNATILIHETCLLIYSQASWISISRVITVWLREEVEFIFVAKINLGTILEQEIIPHQSQICTGKTSRVSVKIPTDWPPPLPMLKFSN